MDPREEILALTVPELDALTPRDKTYIVTDREGLYVEVLPSGSIIWRYRFRVNGKREKLTIGSYPDLTLKEARKKHTKLRARVADGANPAREKQIAKRDQAVTECFEEFAEAWLKDASHSEKWEATQRGWIERDIYPAIGSRKLSAITAGDVLTLLDSIKKRGSPQSALRVRGIIKQVYDHAIGRQRATINPAAQIPSKVVHRPQSRSRTLSETEIRAAYEAIETSGATPQSKHALKLILLTMVRKGELRMAQWKDVDLERREWNIPQTKTGEPHIVYLSQQAVAIFKELKALASASNFVLPSRDDPKRPMGETTLNAVLYGIEYAKFRKGEKWEAFTVHDLRRTASTLLHEQGFDPLVVEKALNHAVRGVAGVYNRAQYAEQRKAMLQHWADYLDAISKGAKMVRFNAGRRNTSSYKPTGTGAT